MLKVHIVVAHRLVTFAVVVIPREVSLNVPCLAESLPLLPLPGLDRRCELEGLDASADRAGLVETSMSAGLLRVGGRLLSCFIDVEGVAFMFFKVVDIPRLAFGVLSLASVRCRGRGNQISAFSDTSCNGYLVVRRLALLGRQ
ncbi:hypothetical protein MRX96_015407 [Rhipicephalus microplus]